MRKTLYLLLVFALLFVIAGMWSDGEDYKEQIKEQKEEIHLLKLQINALDEEVTGQKALVESLQKNTFLDGEWRVADGKATAYSPFDNKDGIQASGSSKVTSIGLTPGPQVIAVDPDKIPYNSQMLVVYEDGSTLSGIAGDTGGALRASRGMRIDVFRTTYEQATQHGVKPVMILWKPVEDENKQ